MKKYLFILMIINIFFITNVYAVDQPSFNVLSTTANTGSASVTVLNGNYPNNKEMRVDFTFLTFTDSYLKEVRIKMSNNNLYNCNLGSVPVDLMKDTGRNRWAYIFTATCPINYNSNISEVVFDYFSTGSTDIILPHNLSIYDLNSSGGGSSTDYTNQLNQIISWGNQIHEMDYYIFDQISTNFPTIISKLETIHQDLINSNTNVVNAINTQTQQQQQQNQIINNTDTSSQSTDFQSTVQNFVVPDTAGIQGVLLQVQSFMSGLEASGRCSPIRIPIPFTDYVVNIPCMTSTIYSVYFPEILAVYQIIVRGIVYYYILVNLLKLFKESIDPFNYRIEVLDL